MIGYLEGILAHQLKSKVIIDVKGVGYLVYPVTRGELPGVGEDVSLYIYTYVREDTLDLYGFNSLKERELFSILISVSRIGPRAALNILSVLSYQEFIDAILAEKIEVLKQVSGVGPKTASRLILELKEKIKKLGGAESPAFAETISGKTGGNNELYQALNNLGYSRREVEEAIGGINLEENDKIEEKIKKVLSYFARESR